MKTLKIEDHGQDFLEWDIDDNGVVIACRPFQGFVWCGMIVLNHATIKTGDHAQLLDQQNEERELRYPILSVEVR